MLRLIEASWGPGEIVAAGRVIPDTFRIDRDGNVIEHTPGMKKIAIRAATDGGTVEETIAAECVSDQPSGRSHRAGAVLRQHEHATSRASRRCSRSGGSRRARRSPRKARAALRSL